VLFFFLPFFSLRKKRTSKIAEDLGGCCEGVPVQPRWAGRSRLPRTGAAEARFVLEELLREWLKSKSASSSGQSGLVSRRSLHCVTPFAGLQSDVWRLALSKSNKGKPRSTGTDPVVCVCYRLEKETAGMALPTPNFPPRGKQRFSRKNVLTGPWKFRSLLQPANWETEVRKARLFVRLFEANFPVRSLLTSDDATALRRREAGEGAGRGPPGSPAWRREPQAALCLPGLRRHRGTGRRRWNSGGRHGGQPPFAPRPLRRPPFLRRQIPSSPRDSPRRAGRLPPLPVIFIYAYHQPRATC